MSKRFGLNLAFLLDGIHIHPKPKPLAPARRVSPPRCAARASKGRVCSQCLNVGRKARHAKVHALRYGEYLAWDTVHRVSWSWSWEQRAPDRRAWLQRTFSKFVAIVSAWFPRRRSEAIATQFLPTMATTLPPLYSIIDCTRDTVSQPK